LEAIHEPKPRARRIKKKPVRKPRRHS
jgi:hypothetical protein